MQNGIVYNGITGSYVGETWEWDGADWQNKSADYNFCCAGFSAAMVYESQRARMVLTGGVYFPGITDTTFVLTSGDGRQTNYVDSIFGSASGDGSLDSPYESFKRGLECSMGSVTLSLKAGNYAEGLVLIDREMRIEARDGSVYLH